MTSLTLDITGMSCSHCVARVNKALTAVPGVRVEQVSVNRATVEYDPAQVAPAQIAEAVTEAGYPARPVVS
jgi:copper chaperone CopZ